MNGKVAEILKKFRTYKRKEFTPNKKAVNHLKEMGFSHNEIIDALRINSNHQDGAVSKILDRILKDNSNLNHIFTELTKDCIPNTSMEILQKYIFFYIVTDKLSQTLSLKKS